MDWGGGAGQNLAPLIEDIGRAKAAGTLARGAILGNTLTSLGQIVAAQPDRDLRRQEIAARTQELQARGMDIQDRAQERQLRVQQAQEQAATRQWIEQAVNDPTMRNEDGTINFSTLAAHVAPRDQKSAENFLNIGKTIEATKQSQADALASILEQAPDEFTAAAALHGSNVSPDRFGQFQKAVETNGYDAARQAILTQSPAWLKRQQAIADETAKEKGKPHVLSPGAQLVAGGQVVAENPKTAPAEGDLTKSGLDVQAAAALARGDAETYNRLLKVKKEMGQADDRAPSAAAQAVVTLSPEGLDAAALQFKKSGTLPPMGMGPAAAKVRTDIINRAAKLTPEDTARIEAGGMDIAGNRADYRADSGSLATLKKQRDAIGAFENTAQKNIDLFLETAGKVVDTGSPLANSFVRAVSGKVLGSPDQAAFEAARQVAINEVAKITSNPTLAGQLSDSARKEVEAFNPANATLKQSVAVMRTLKRDMDNRRLSLDSAIAEVQTRLKGGTAPIAAPIRRPIPSIPGGVAESTDGGKTWKRVQ